MFLILRGLSQYYISLFQAVILLHITVVCEGSHDLTMQEFYFIFCSWIKQYTEKSYWHSYFCCEKLSKLVSFWLVVIVIFAGVVESFLIEGYCSINKLSENKWDIAFKSKGCGFLLITSRSNPNTLDQYGAISYVST